MNVLVGIDLKVQGHAELIDRANRVADLLGGRVDLLHVSPKPTDEQRALLGGLLSLVSEPHRGDTRVVAGDPAEQLIEQTASVDVLVLGPKEPAALQRWLQGPMAVRVLPRSKCPIYVPRSPTPWATPPRLLVGVDIHGDMSAILSFSSRWGQALQGSVDLVYALPGGLPPIKDRALRDQAQKDYVASRKTEQRALDALLMQLPESVRGTGVLQLGEPEDVLGNVSTGYDLVMVGNRGRTGMARLLMGNIAHYVVRNAKCDVLVLPTAQAT